MKQKIIKLIDLKSIVTLIVITTFVYGFVVGKINTEDFMRILMLVVTFYFAKTKGGENNE